MVTLSAREFNRDVSAAKRAAEREPVIITERGRPSHVLMTVDEYYRLTGGELDIVEWLSADDGIDLDIPPANLELTVPDL
jgi:prevent-host-death family protein